MPDIVRRLRAASRSCGLGQEEARSRRCEGPSPPTLGETARKIPLRGLGAQDWRPSVRHDNEEITPARLNIPTEIRHGSFECEPELPTQPALPGSRGFTATYRAALQLRRPFMIVHPGETSSSVVRARIVQQHIRVLNVAGNRESVSPGIGERA